MIWFWSVWSALAFFLGIQYGRWIDRNAESDE